MQTLNKNEFKEIKEVWRYKYNKQADNVIITKGMLYKKEAIYPLGKKDRRAKEKFKDENGTVYEYGFHGYNTSNKGWLSDIAADEGIILRGTFWLDERNDKKAYDIIQKDILKKEPIAIVLSLDELKNSNN